MAKNGENNWHFLHGHFTGYLARQKGLTVIRPALSVSVLKH